MGDGDETCCLITAKTRDEHATTLGIGTRIYTAYHEFDDVDPKVFVDHRTETNA